MAQLFAIFYAVHWTLIYIELKNSRVLYERWETLNYMGGG